MHVIFDLRSIFDNDVSIAMHTTEQPKNPAQRREWIKYQLRLKGWSMRGLAKHHGYSPAAFTNTLLRPYPKVEGLIAATLDATPQTLWPERYAADGKPNRHSARYPRKGITREKRRQCIKFKGGLT